MQQSVTIHPDFQQLLTAYTSSKVLRLGAAYLDGNFHHREALSQQASLALFTLRKYARRCEQYQVFSTRAKKRWHYSEDNYLMAHYQFKRLPSICEGLPNRTRNAIVQRAIFLGVAKERKAFTN